MVVWVTSGKWNVVRVWPGTRPEANPARARAGTAHVLTSLTGGRSGLELRDRRANRQGAADQFRTIIRHARELAGNLDRDTFNRRPDSGGWSVAECLDHLNATARVYLPVIAEAMEDARARGWTGRSRGGLTLKGRLITWMTEPPARFRRRTFQELEPATGLDPGAVLDEFEALHEELIVRINESGSLDRRRIRIRSVLDPRLELTLADWFAFLAAHDRRHLWQAQGLVESLRSTL
jgi:hypothetical protein